MNHADRIRRPLASLTRRAGALLARGAAAPATAATPRPQPPRRNGHSPWSAPARTTLTAELRGGARPHAPRERLRTRILPARLPHAIQLCIHCQLKGRPGSGSAARTARQCAGPGACPAARN